MDFARDRIAVKLLAAALAFLATFAAVRAFDGGTLPVGIDGGDGDLSAGFEPSATTAQRIEALEAQVLRSPSDPQGYVDLGSAYLTRYGETENPDFYPKARQASETALKLDPNDFSVLAGMAQLELSQHRFRRGLALAEQARRINPSTVETDGMITDAQIELGRYGAAARTLQRYVGRRPELGSYARVSYFRELHGDLDGAIRAMQLAAAAAGDSSADSVFATTLIGKHRADQGDYAAAEAIFRRVLALDPASSDARLGLAAIEAGRGHSEGALDLYRAVQRSIAAPDHAILLGEAEETAGHRAAAGQAYQAARVAFEREEAAGTNTAAERAIFEADHGDPATAVAFGRRAWRYTPSVRGADAYAWALSAAGRHRAALRFSERAMRLGSRDPYFLYHAGIVAFRAGQSERARAFLGRLIAQSPWFSPLHGPRAQQALDVLPPG
jgi:tetratricopeptide (TPR) repeat protein